MSRARLVGLLIPATMLTVACVSALGKTTKLYDGDVPPSKIARVQVFTTSELRIGPHYVPRQPRGGGRFIEVPGGNYSVKLGMLPAFEWQAIGGETYGLGVTARNMTTDSTIHLFASSAFMRRDGSSEVVESPGAGTVFAVVDSARLYPPAERLPEARIEIGRPLMLTGFSGRTADGRRVSCAEGSTYLTQVTPQRAITTAACGIYVRARSLRVLPGTYTVQVVYVGTQKWGGSVSETIQVDATEVASVSPDVDVKWVGSDEFRLMVTKTKAR